MICHSSNPKSSLLTWVMAVHSTNHALTAVIMILKDRNSLHIKIKKMTSDHCFVKRYKNLCTKIHESSPNYSQYLVSHQSLLQRNYDNMQEIYTVG